MSDDEPISDDEAGVIVDMILRLKAMKETAAYLNAGRRFSSLKLEDLHMKWVKIFKQLVEQRRSPPDMGDLIAEYELRKIKPPMHLVQQEQEAFKALIANLSENDMERIQEGLSEDLDDISWDLAKPSN